MKLKVMAAMLVATTAMALTPIEDLNKAVVELLKSINNKLTTAELVFTALEVDDVRAQRAGIKLLFKKKGELTDLVLSVPDLSYDYEASDLGPIAEGEITATADLLAILDREMINEMGPEIAEIMQDLAEGFLEEYGTAASVSVETLEAKYDDEGNLVRITVKGDVRVNLEMLPPTIPVNEVPIKAATMTLTAGLDSLGISGVVTMNRDYKAFDEDQQGLKDLIEELLSQDKETMQYLEEGLQFIDAVIGQAVNEGFKGGEEDEDEYDEEMDLLSTGPVRR